MQPIVEPRASSGLGHRLALTALVGVSVLSVAVVAMLTIYVDRISEVASSLHRVDALADYDGRPAAVQVAENPAINFLIFIDSGDKLQAAVIANLSGSRRHLTLAALPADLLVSGSAASLARTYASDPLRATRMVEEFSGARMDHQLRLDVMGFDAVVDRLDGLNVGDRQLSGADAVGYLAQAGAAADRSQRAAQLIRQTMIKAKDNGGVLNLPRFDSLIGALGDCLTIDDGLTNDAIQNVLVESRVHLDDVRLWPIGGASTSAGTRADPATVALLRSGLASDDLARTPQESSAATAQVGAVHSAKSDATSGGASLSPSAGADGVAVPPATPTPR